MPARPHEEEVFVISVGQLPQRTRDPNDPLLDAAMPAI